MQSMTLGQRIAAIRKTAGLSQEAFGEMLGVTRQSVSKWEADQNNPELSYLIEICNRFAVSADYLLLGKELSNFCDQKVLPQTNLVYRFGCFLTVFGGLLLTALYYAAPQGYTTHSFYGFWGWLAWGWSEWNKSGNWLHRLPLVAFLACCATITLGIFFMARQTFQKQKSKEKNP